MNYTQAEAAADHMIAALMSGASGYYAETRRRFVADPDDPRHGTKNGYDNLGCRCRRCRDAKAAYQRGGGPGKNRMRTQRRKETDGSNENPNP